MLDEPNKNPVISPNSNSATKQEVSVDPPLVSLIPVPVLTMHTVTVDFDDEVDSSNDSSHSSDNPTGSSLNDETGYDGKRGFNTKITGRGIADLGYKGRTKSSDTYKIHARAAYQPPVAGMDKLITLLDLAEDPITLPKKDK